MLEEKLYKQSEIYNLPGFISAIILGSLLAVFLGFIYNFLIVTIPLVYVNLFLCAGYGAVLGYGIKYFSRFGKIRNTRQNLFLAGVVGFVGFYFQWIAYFVFLNSGEHSFQAYQENFNLIYNPALFLELLFELNKVGSWEMFGVIFTDFALWVIWGLEALLIIGIPLLIAYKHPIIPFSENFNQWYTKYVFNNQFESIVTQNQFKENLLKNTEETINALSYGDPFRFSEISMFYIKGEQNQYLSIDNVFIEDRGKGKSVRTSIIHSFKIDNDTAQNLMEKFKSKKLNFYEY